LNRAVSAATKSGPDCAVSDADKHTTCTSLEAGELHPSESGKTVIFRAKAKFLAQLSQQPKMKKVFFCIY